MAANARYALVLAAGYGKRMGPLGHELAKPLWPVFGTTILGHLINQLLEKDFKKIFVNTHHLHQQVSNYLKTHYPSVIILNEDPILDSGGAIINCAHHIGETQGELYTFNGDNIIDLTNFNYSSAGDITLFSEEVPKESAYNRLVIEGGVLKKIMPYSEEASLTSNLTYSGISIFKLSSHVLKAKIVPRGIFKDMLNFERDQVHIQPFHGLQVDLGTREKYVEGLRFLLSQAQVEDSSWVGFLKVFCLLKPELINNQQMSYAAGSAEGTFNFGTRAYDGTVTGAIIFDDSWQQVMSHSLHFAGGTYPYGL